MPWHHNDLSLSLSLSLSFLIICYNGTYDICLFIYYWRLWRDCYYRVFPHIIVLEDSSPESTDDKFEDIDTFLNLWISNSWRFILLGFILPLEYFTVGILYCWNILLRGYFFIAVYFLLCWRVCYRKCFWAISYPCQSHPRPKV